VMAGKALKNLLGSIDSRRVFISNIPLSITEDSLRNMLEEYAFIQNVYLITKQGKKTQIGFATVEENEDRAKLLNAKIKTNGLKLYISAYKRKEDINKKNNRLETKFRAEYSEDDFEPNSRKRRRNYDLGNNNRNEYAHSGAYYKKPGFSVTQGVKKLGNDRPQELKINSQKIENQNQKFNSKFMNLNKKKSNEIDQSIKPTNSVYFYIRRRNPYFINQFYVIDPKNRNIFFNNTY